MRLFNTRIHPVVELDGRYYDLTDHDWDTLFNRRDLESFLRSLPQRRKTLTETLADETLVPPIASQEVWAAGVTYYRSRDARMEEAESDGGASFYDKVYSAPRPELFFKATPSRVAGHGQAVRIRTDSKWNVPEPELTLAVNSSGRIFGYTIGNDMSSRDIEGENPLYLPQAKVYDKSCALGPGIYVTDDPLPRETAIRLEIHRAGKLEFEGQTDLTQIKRSFESLVEYLFRDNVFPNGCYLLTGTGIVPPNSFTLQRGDEIRIAVDPIGSLTNWVS